MYIWVIPTERQKRGLVLTLQKPGGEQCISVLCRSSAGARVCASHAITTAASKEAAQNIPFSNSVNVHWTASKHQNSYIEDMLLTLKKQLYISISKAHRRFFQVVWGRSARMNIHRSAEGGGNWFYEFMKYDWLKI